MKQQQQQQQQQRRQQAGRHRRRTWVAMAMMCTTLCTTTSPCEAFSMAQPASTSASAFTPASTMAPANAFTSRPLHEALPRPTSALAMTAATTLTRTESRRGRRTATAPSPPSRMPRLTAEEESELLRQAVEMRRLKNIETDLASKSPSKSMPLLSVRAKASGYGDELDLYEDAMIDGQCARDTLVTRNMGLVHYVVNQIAGKQSFQSQSQPGKRNTGNSYGGSVGKLNSLSRDDLVQEGAIGLARAIDRWNPEIGGKFSTYAMYWVRAAVLQCIAERDDVVRVPTHVTRAISQINKAAKVLGVEIDVSQTGISSIGNLYGDSHALGGAPSQDKWEQATAAKMLAETAGLSDKQLAYALKARNRRYTGGYVAFETWMQQGKELMQDTPLLASDGAAEIDDSDREHMRQALSKFLRPREMEALSWRYGLYQSGVDMDMDVEADATVLQQAMAKTESKPMMDARANANEYLRQAELDLFGSIQEPVPLKKKQKPQQQQQQQRQPSIPTKGRWGEAMTFNEVGKHMHVSAEYGRKLCHKALEKLRTAAEDGRLEPGLLM